MEGFITGREAEIIRRIKHDPATSWEVPNPGFSGKLDPYQWEGVAFLCVARRGILKYFVGSGKTPITIASDLLLRSRGKVRKTLIVSLIGVRWHWLKEYNKYSDLRVKVIDGTPKSRIRQWLDSSETDVFVSHYEAIRCDIGFLMKNRDAVDFDIIAFDEASFFRSRGTKILKALRLLVGKRDYVWGLTATPIQKRLEDLFWIMQIINYPVLGKFNDFKERYCIEEEGYGKGRLNLWGRVTGVGEDLLVDDKADFAESRVRPGDAVTNTVTESVARVVAVQSGQVLVVQPGIFPVIGSRYNLTSEDTRVRKFKKVVGYRNVEDVSCRIDLYVHSKTQDEVESIDRQRVRLPRTLELGDRQRELYRDVQGGLETCGREMKTLLEKFQLLEYAAGTTAFFDPEIRERRHDREHLNFNMFRRHESSKIDDLMFLLDTELDGEKVVVFSKYLIQHYHLIHVLDDHGIQWTEITGDVHEPEQRERNRVRFIEDPECRVCLLSSVGEMGFNLHSARYIIFLNEFYNPARQEQLIGRIDRPHLQTSKIVSSIHYYAQDTFEPDLHDRMDRERAVSNQVFGEQDLVESMRPEDLFALMKGVVAGPDARHDR